MYAPFFNTGVDSMLSALESQMRREAAERARIEVDAMREALRPLIGSSNELDLLAQQFYEGAQTSLILQYKKESGERLAETLFHAVRVAACDAAQPAAGAPQAG